MDDSSHAQLVGSLGIQPYEHISKIMTSPHPPINHINEESNKWGLNASRRDSHHQSKGKNHDRE